MGAVSSALWDTIKTAGHNIKEVGAGGEYVASALKGAAIVGGIGGVTEWAQGGSFWSGAKSGMVNGALIGAGYRAAKVGIAGGEWANHGIGEVAGGYKGLYQDIKAGSPEGGVSKQVQAIFEQKKAANIAQMVMNSKK